MLRHRTATTFAVILALATFSGCDNEKASTTKRVRILVTTDEHSHLLATAPEKDEWPLKATAGTGALKGGVARRATVIEQEKADGVPTVLLSNGDFSQGTLSAVAFTVANFDAMLMRLMGYDAVALGNHEFDSLPAGLAASIAAAKAKGGAPQFVLTNALTTTGTALDESAATPIYGGVGSGRAIVKGLVIDKGGIRVGVVSAIGPSAAFDGQYTAAPVTFSTASLASYGSAYVKAANTNIGEDILQPVVDQLRAGGAQVVVLLFHGGLRSTGSNGDLDGTGTGAGRVDGIVEHLSGVDVIFGGHTHGVPALLTTYVADLDGRQVPVMQAAAYGNQIARAEFTVEDGRVTFDGPRAAELTVDDTVLPTSDQEIRAALSTSISGIEASVLPLTLQAVTGSAILDNPVDVGDLYFFKVGTTTFDVTGATERAETNALNLDTDAMLWVATILGQPATVALQNAGSIRGDLVQGSTGILGFSDVYRMVSLGADPIEQSPGYPLIQAYLGAADLRAALEQTLQLSYLNNDYYLGSAGISLAWDPGRTAFTCDPIGNPTGCAINPGWVTSFEATASDATVVEYNPTAYPASAGWAVDGVPSASGPTKLIPVVTTYLVASFAGKMGVTLRDSGGAAVTDLSTRIVHWPTTAHVKDHQALAKFIYAPAGMGGLGGVMPAAYNQTMPVRATCSSSGVIPCPYP